MLGHLPEIVNNFEVIIWFRTQERECHRSALSAGWMAAKHSMADCLFSKKENAFCTIFLVSWLMPDQ